MRFPSFANTPEGIKNKERFLSSVDRASRKFNKDTTGSAEGGTYVCFTRKSNERLIKAIGKITGLSNKSVLLDIGSGLNLPALFALILFGCTAIGVEICEYLAMQGARTWIKAIQTYGAPPEHYKLAFAVGDILDMDPAGTGITHAFSFDSVFTPELYIHVLEWISRTNIEYFITSKPTRENGYYQVIEEILGPYEVLGKVSGLSVQAGKEQHSFAILRRKDVHTIRNVPPQHLYQRSLNVITRPFLGASYNTHKSQYDGLLADYDRERENEGIVTRSRAHARINVSN